MANNKQWGDFKGITLKAYTNKYYNGKGYQYKISDAKTFFLDKFGKWLKSSEIQNLLKDPNRKLKVGVKQFHDDKDLHNVKEGIEKTFYVGHNQSPTPQYQKPIPPVHNYQPDPELDDEVPF